MIDIKKAGKILEHARQAAIDYHDLTGKPLGITGEIGEYMTAKILGLELADARSPGYDTTDKKGRKIQIKARRILRKKKLSGHVGSISLDHEWDCVMLILFDERFEPQAIFEADRGPLKAALAKPGSKARNERGALSISKFRSVGTQIWSAESALAQE